MQKKYHVIGMSCASCAASVERILKKQTGVLEAEVNLILEEVVVQITASFNLKLSQEALQKAGFRLEDVAPPTTQVFQVNNMSCASCAASVERILNKFDEIDVASVNLVLQQVSITFQTKNINAWQAALEKAGFILVDASTLHHVLLDIEGMTCASCASAIERVVSKQNGVTSIQVNLVMNQATLSYDASLIKLSELIQVIRRAGFDAHVHQEKELTTPKDQPSFKVYFTLVIASVLLYIGMSHMLGSIELPLPAMIHYQLHPFAFAFIQFVLATIILAFGHKFFTRGIKALFHKTPNMDTLVAIGTGSAYIYSVISLIQIAQGNVHAVHSLYFESAGVVVALVQFGKHLESLSKRKSTGAISALLQLRPTTATLWRDGEEIEVSIEEIGIHDQLIVRPGEHIPVDGNVIYGEANVDESMLTGESMPVKKVIDNQVIQGTINLDGKLRIICNATQDETTLSKIIQMVEEAQGKKAPIARIADRISLYFVPVVIFIAIAAALLWYIALQDLSFSLTIFVSVLVIACPCALGLATPTAIMVGTGKAASHGVFIKSGEALETASHIDTIVFDKTGTLTIGKPVVTDIACQGDEKEVLRLAAALENGSKHPLATAILTKCEELDIEIPSLATIQTINGKGLAGEYQGKTLMVGSKSFLALQHHPYETQEHIYQEAGKTVIYICFDGELIGLIAIADQLKSESNGVVKQLQSMGIDVIMLTGDHQTTAQAIATQAGITHVIAQVLPDGKSEEIKKLQAKGRCVAMVGDGINDAIALTQSEVGIAIGSGSDVAIESASVVLMKDRLDDVVTAIRLSKAVIRNIHQNLFWAFFYNALGIPIAAGVLHVFHGPLLSPVFAGAAMALSSVCVVSNALRLRNFK